MGAQKMRLYRLDITLPAIGNRDADEFDPGWVPPAWAQVDREMFERDSMRAVWAEGGHVPEDWEPDWSAYRPHPWPGWPAAKTYFSKSGAEARASLFRRYGASVVVVASAPVVWPDVDQPAEPPRAPLHVVGKDAPSAGRKRSVRSTGKRAAAR